jgi:hypothetical protein
MARTHDAMPLRVRVQRFLSDCWQREHARELAAKAEVQAQTSECAYQVKVPVGARLAEHSVYFGFVHPDWRDTVRCLEQMGVPAALPFPDAESFAAVTQSDVRALEARLQTDVLLRVTLLQELASGKSSVAGKRARFGQQWLREFLLRTDWPLPCPVVLNTCDDGAVGAHGVVESLFIRAAASVPADKWQFVFVCMLAFIARSVDAGCFVPLPPSLHLALADEAAQAELAQWLLHYYDDWADTSGEFVQSLARLSRAWRRHYSSAAQFRATLPPTTCYSFDAFESAASTLTSAGAVPPPHPPPSASTPAQSLETRGPAVRMTARSSLFPPRYLREATPETYL